MLTKVVQYVCIAVMYILHFLMLYYVILSSMLYEVH